MRRKKAHLDRGESIIRVGRFPTSRFTPEKLRRWSVLDYPNARFVAQNCPLTSLRGDRMRSQNFAGINRDWWRNRMRRFVMSLTLSFAGLVLVSSAAHAACTGSQVLFQDNFQSMASNWGSPDDNHSVKNGMMVVSPPVNQTYTYLNSGNIFTDMSACVDVTATAGGPKQSYLWGGLAFWATDVNNQYFFAVAPFGTFSVSRYLNKNFYKVVDWTANAAIKKGLNQVNRLSAVIKGNQATFFVNDTQVATITGQPPQGGGEVGLIANSGPGSRSVFEFANLKVTN
jgi:hypothetical protein